MIRQERINIFYEMCPDSSLYMESGKTFNNILLKIKNIITKIKDFINEKILKKEKKVEKPPEIEVDKGVWSKIKSGLKSVAKFLTMPLDKISKAIGVNKGIVAVVLAVIGIASVKDLKNGHKVKVKREEYENTIRRCKDCMEYMKNHYNYLNDHERWMKDNGKKESIIWDRKLKMLV